MDEEQIEYMIESCLAAVHDDDSKFTGWEISFLESIEDANDSFHLSEAQIDKLTQIYDDKVA